MAFVAVSGLWLPEVPPLAFAPSYNVATIDATGEKYAWVGRVWNNDRATKDIKKVSFLFGSVTKAGGSGLTLSLQDVDLVNGPPFRPDGTPDQTVAIANAAIIDFGWFNSGALSANRTVAFGEFLAIVLEFDGSGRLGADSIAVRDLGVASGTSRALGSGGSLFTGSWTVQQAVPNIVLEFSDGTFGTLDYGIPASDVTSNSYNTGSTPDEHALQFSVPFSCKVDGFWAVIGANAAGRDFDVVLYEGTTPLQTVSIDTNAVDSPSVRVLIRPFAAEQELTPGTTYYLSVKPTTANSINFYYSSVDTASHFQARPPGTSWVATSRTDAGAWSAATNTKRFWAGLRLSAVAEATGSGRAMLVNNANVVA